MHNLKNDKTIVIKGADKGSAVALWDREDYNKEAENQLEDTNIYKEVPNDAKTLINILLNTLENIRNREDVCTNTLNYFITKDATFANFHILPEIYKRLHNVPGRPVIPIVDMILRIFFHFLDFRLQPVQKNSKNSNL